MESGSKQSLIFVFNTYEGLRNFVEHIRIIVSSASITRFSFLPRSPPSTWRSNLRGGVCQSREHLPPSAYYYLSKDPGQSSSDHCHRDETAVRGKLIMIVAPRALDMDQGCWLIGQ